MAKEPPLQGPGRFRHQGARLQTDGGSVGRTDGAEPPLPFNTGEGSSVCVSV